MFGMALKQKTRKDRMISLCAWALMLVLGVTGVITARGEVRFLPPFQVAVALMAILREIKGLIEEPS
jgi:hypothetical protein